MAQQQFPPIVINGKKLIFKKILTSGKISYRCSKHSSRKCKANFQFQASDISRLYFEDYVILTDHSGCGTAGSESLANTENSQGSLNTPSIINSQI